MRIWAATVLLFLFAIPVVVYVPDGIEVRYRIWTAGAEVNAIENG